MNYKLLIIPAVVALIFAGCAKENIVEKQTGARVVSVSATVPTTTETRTAFYDGSWNHTAGYGFKVKWAVGDKMSILCWQGDDAANWGNLISTKDANGNVTDDKGEIIYTLTANDISPDGRTVNFSFAIPDQITNTSQPVKVLITYLGNCFYLIYHNSGQPGYHLKPWLRVKHAPIESAADRQDLAYITRTMPMTLRGEIAAGWNAGATQAVFDGQFRHLAALLAVQLRNATGAPIDPKQIVVYFQNGTVMNNYYHYWNPLFPVVPYSEGNQYTLIGMSHSQSIAAGGSFVYFMPLLFTEAPTKAQVSFKDRTSTELKTNVKTTTIALQTGKCYTFNTVVNSVTDTGGGPNTDFAWDTNPPVQAPWEQ